MLDEKTRTPAKEETRLKRVVRAFKQWKTAEETTAKDLSHFCSEVLFLGADQKFGSDGTELNTKIEDSFFRVNRSVTELQGMKVTGDLSSILPILERLEEYHRLSYSLIQECRKTCIRANDIYLRQEEEANLMLPPSQVLLQGQLQVKGKKGWKKRTIQLTKANLVVFKHETSEVLHNIHLVVCSVRPATEEKKNYCFSVFNPSVIITFQAQDRGEMDVWIATIQSHILGCLEDNEPTSGGRKRRTTIDEDDGELRQNSGLRNSSSWSSKSPIKARKRSSAPKMQSEIVHPITTPGPLLGLKDLNIGDQADALALSPRMDVATYRGKENTEYSVLEELYAMDSANRLCADCHAESPTWISINLGCLLCINCSGIHRGLGAHVSKVRSLTLDTIEPHVKRVVELIGNAFLNSILEADLPATFNKGLLASNHTMREQFIKEKHVHRQFCSKYKGDKEGSLIQAIKMDNPPGAAALVLFGANVRASEGMRSALHYSAQRGSSEVMSLLLLNGADPNVVDSVRLTPLHYAARANKIDCVKLLLKYGANAVAIDDLGRKPIDIADAGAKEIREALSNASNQSGSKNL
jgi:hypothetical protein